MFLSNFSIKQPVTTVAIVILMMAVGLLALKHLRVNQIPDVQEPGMVVQFPYPGASPETVEREPRIQPQQGRESRRTVAPHARD